MVHIIVCKLYLHKHSWEKIMYLYTLYWDFCKFPNLTNLPTFIHSMCLAKEFPFNLSDLGYVSSSGSLLGLPVSCGTLISNAFRFLCPFCGARQELVSVSVLPERL